MGMDPHKFIDVAEKLCKDDSNEAALRSAVSRSYYGTFNLIAQFCRNNIVDFKNSLGHKLLCRCLHGCDINNVKLMASTLGDLLDERNKADYELSNNKFKNPNVAQIALLKAKTLYKEFNCFISNSGRRKQIINGIRKHMKIERGEKKNK